MPGETVADKLDRIHGAAEACDRCDKPEVNHSVHLAEASFYFCDECSVSGKMSDFMTKILRAREEAKLYNRAPPAAPPVAPLDYSDIYPDGEPVG